MTELNVTDYRQMEMRDVGNEVIVAGGEYEVANYAPTGASHSNDWVSVNGSIRALCIGYLDMRYNVAVETELGTHTIIMVPDEDITTYEDVRSQNEASMDAEYHAAQLVDALQDADAPKHMLDYAESVYEQASDINNKRQ